MSLFALLFGLLIPRVLITALLLWSTWFQGVPATPFWFVFSYIFMPNTLLWFSAMHHWSSDKWGIMPLAALIIAVLIDFSPLTSRRGRRGRR
jgi:uncharacterized membrane protein required for colicin V production